MANEVVRTIRIRGVSEGVDELTAKLEKLRQAENAGAAAAEAAATATEKASQRRLSASGAVEKIIQRTDEAARATARFSRGVDVLQWGRDSGYFAKSEQAALSYTRALHGLQRELEAVGTKGAAISQVDLHSKLGLRMDAAPSARESAAAFESAFAKAAAQAEAEAALIDKVLAKTNALREARVMANAEFTGGRSAMRAQEAGAAFQADLTSRLVSGSSKSARDSASVFEAEMKRFEEVASMRAQEAGAAFQADLNHRLGVTRDPINTAGIREQMTSRFASEDSWRAQAQAQRMLFEDSKEAMEKQAVARAAQLTQSLLPMTAELNRHQEILADIAHLEKTRVISLQQAVELRSAEEIRTAKSQDSIKGMFIHQSKYGSAVGLARHEMINLSRQVQDVVVSLQAGQSPLTVLVQQGSQIADIFSSSPAGATGAMKALASAISPVHVAIGGLAGSVLGAAAAWVAYDSSQRSAALSLEGIGRGAGLVVSELNAIAVASARIDRLSVSQARATATAIAGTGRVDGSLVGGITRASYGYGMLSGKNEGDAGKDLAAAFADPVRGAEELNRRIGFLNGALQDYIRNAVASGDRTAAQKAMLDAMSPSVQRATEHTNAFAKAWHAVWNAASNAADAIGKAIAGPSIEEQLKRAERQLEQAKKSGGLLFGFGPDGIARLERQRDGLRVQADFERKQADSLKREQQANDLGLTGNTVVRSILEDVQRLESLRNNKSLIERVIGDPEALAKTGRTTEEVGKALSNVNGMLSVFASAAQRATEDGQLQVRSIMALTLAERVAVEAQRAWIEVMRQSGDAATAAAQAEAARNRVIAEANRQARDALRDAQLEARLVGLSPYQRGLQQIRNDRFRDMQQNGGGAGVVGAYGPQLPGGAAGVDTGFRSKVLALIDAVGDAGARMTSGFRTREKQQELYDYYGPGKAARPGSSQHEHGTAMDYVFSSPEARARAMGMAQQFGLRALGSNGGAVHFDMGRGGRAANDNGVDDASRVAAWRTRESTFAAEQQTGPFVQSRLAIEAQTRTLDLYRQVAFSTGAEQAALNEKMRLYAEFARNGVPVTEGMRAQIDEMAASAGRLAGQMQAIDFAKNQFTEWGSAERDGVKGFFSDLVNSARQGEFSLKSVGQAFTSLISKLADKSVNMLIDRLFFGMNGGTGGGGLLGAIFGGGGSRTGSLYADGGYTGRGGKYEPAGIVHRGEYVFDAAATSRIGVHALEAMRRGLPGYADGGYVSAPAAVAPPSIPTANSNSPASITINVTGATGNEEVKRMVAAGMQQAFQMSQADTKRNAVNYFRDAQVRYG